jgi:hypothetical protein
MTKKQEANYVFRSAAILLYINKISVTEVSYFFQDHGAKRDCTSITISTGITLTSGSRTAAILVRYGNKKVKVMEVSVAWRVYQYVSKSHDLINNF